VNVARAAGVPASTLDPDEAAERCWPVVVVGAGPAGIALALALRRAGIDVLVIERADFPRPKACGGCLAPAALAALRSLDADAAAAPSTPTARIVLRVGERTFERSLAGGRAVDRAAFDAHLAGRFVACGGCLLTGRAVESVGPDGRVVLAGGAVVRGELVAIATGLGPGSGDRDGRRWSLGPMRGPAAGRVGLAATLPAEGIDPEGAIAMHVGAAGYVGAVRLRVPGAGEILHLGAALWSADLRAAGDPGAVVTALLEPTWPELSARLRNDPGAVRWRGAGRMNRRRTRVAGGRVVAIGDAAGYVEPFTGEGVGWAMDDGRALAREVIEHGSARAAERWSRVRSARARRRERRCRLLRPLLDRPRVLELALGAVGGGPGPRSAAGGRIVELLSGGRLGGPVRRGPPDARPAGRARPSGAGFRPIEPVLLGLGTATPPTTRPITMRIIGSSSLVTALISSVLSSSNTLAT